MKFLVNPGAFSSDQMAVVNSPTENNEEPEARRWKEHRGISLALRIVAFWAPIIATFLATMAFARIIPAQESLRLQILWWCGILATGILTVLVTERLARRLLPLSVLFKLSLVFPDRVPSRFSLALRSGTTRQLQRRIEQLRDEGITGDDTTEHPQQMLELVAALSAHDRLTRGHSERVRAYTDLLMDELKLPSEEQDLLRWAALIHDVGKLHISPEILASTTGLDADQWDELRTHTTLGRQLAAPLEPWLGEWLAAVDQHHERWDGTGYPLGLAGTEIHYGARIVAVADAFDAMTSVRSYKKAIPVAKCRAEIQRSAGSHFDPDVVRAFLNIGIGKLRFKVGPLAALATVPVFGPTTKNPFARPAAIMAGLLLLLLTGATDRFIDDEPTTLAFGDESELAADGGGSGSGASDGDADPADTEPTVDTTAVPTTAPPTTATPTTAPPTTAPPTTTAPATTAVPATAVPTSAVPTTAAPIATTTPPTTAAPTTTTVPVTTAPTTAPTTTTTIPRPTVNRFVVNVSEDSSSAFAVDVTGAVSSVELLTPSSLGVIVFDSLLSGTFTPHPDVSGIETLTLEACNAGGCAQTTFDVSVAARPDDPVAVADALTAVAGGTTTFTNADLLANDVDPDGGILTVFLGWPSVGHLTQSGSTYTYTAPAGYDGTASIPYRVCDRTDRCASSSITVVVTPA